jgi:hypothetical protein
VVACWCLPLFNVITAVVFKNFPNTGVQKRER